MVVCQVQRLNAKCVSTTSHVRMSMALCNCKCQVRADVHMLCEEAIELVAVVPVMSCARSVLRQECFSKSSEDSRCFVVRQFYSCGKFPSADTSRSLLHRCKANLHCRKPLARGRQEACCSAASSIIRQISLDVKSFAAKNPWAQLYLGS